MKITKWGIVGPGSIARDFVKDLSLISSTQLVQAVLGHTEKNTLQFAKEFNVPQVFMELDDFIEKADIDIVYVASPHALHHEQVLACLKKKIPVLCEKPLTINANQSMELIDTARINNTFLMEGMWLRFLPSIKLMMELINAGKIGNIISVKASISYKAPHDPGSRYFDPAMGGGSLLDLGIYPVFLALLLLGKPDTIKAIGSLSEEGVDENCSMLFHYKNGQQAILESSLISQTEMPAEIIGEKGIIKILNPWFEKAAGLELNVYNEGKIILPCRWEGHGLHFETEEVLNCIEENKIESDVFPHHFSLDLIMLMDKIRNQVHVIYEMDE
ncbi:MAG: Gfo/Idh/MocA family oxidoreductase [Chitinophagaceae bacterium]